MKKPERKITEKNRRNNMKFLYSHLFSLIPPHLISKGGDQVTDRVDTAIHYIQTLKASLEMNKNKKEHLLSKKRSYQHTKTNISLDIQIQEMSPDLDAVLITGLKNHSDFCHVIQLLDQYSTEVALANFSSSGHSIFHLRHKKIEAEEIAKRIKILIEGSSYMKELELELGLELELELGNDNIDGSSSSSNISIWDFDFQSNKWGWELEMLPMSILS
ncbi:hypothetical protein L6452_17295 [Arctium lappa]|uniref:Uncharacterized protein n=1 Tax=Arctium lappa TaxID=4217 RepID=A0ACB9C2W0_ARCLA|nr:hypothetical protein L6452_17295 [Arctium lappa]